MQKDSKPPHATQVKYYKGLLSVATVLQDIMKPMVKKRGFVHYKIVTDWHLIVGEKIAQHTVPQKIIFPRYHEENKEGAVLYIDVYNGGIAMELHYMQPLIIEKIAAYFGYGAIAQLKITQRPTPCAIDQPTASYRPPLLSSEAHTKLQTLMEGVKDHGLQDALSNLGRHIVGKNTR